jgi:hypothetical protein
MWQFAYYGVDKTTFSEHNCHMIDMRSTIDQIGAANLAQALGYGQTAISNAVSRGAFPPSWYLVVTDLAKKRGVEVPKEMFGFHRSHQAANDNHKEEGE